MGNSESVAKFIFNVFGLFDGFADLVKAARLKSDADSLVELVILVASLEHLSNDVFHLCVDLNALLFPVNNGDSLLDVLIDALVDESLNILTSLIEIESVASFQSQTKSLFVFLKVVEDLGSQRGCEVFLGEGRIVNIGLTTKYLVNLDERDIYSYIFET